MKACADKKLANDDYSNRRIDTLNQDFFIGFVESAEGNGEGGVKPPGPVEAGRGVNPPGLAKTGGGVNPPGPFNEGAFGVFNVVPV